MVGKASAASSPWSPKPRCDQVPWPFPGPAGTRRSRQTLQGSGCPGGAGVPVTVPSTRTGRVRIEEGASLRIDLLRAEDQGWYECRVLFLDRHSTDADFRNGTWVHLTVTGNREIPPSRL